MQAAVEAVGSIDDQLKLADWIRTHQVDTILGPLSWNEDGSPQGDFLIGQWINGTAEIVLPPDLATAKPEIGWHPGS
jgi:branched-chain amino acid transport system substrate-binding protein